ncbi:MAG: hypothetical protein K8M05_11315 [Deltaproteobacteria bacterium]|nr:hypothetical protein [Kofleriaceae bacterium]
MVIGQWQVHGADADEVLAAAWELGRARVGHLYIDAPAGLPMWWWSCCCGVGGGLSGGWAVARLALAGFMTAHRWCARCVVEACDPEMTPRIGYEIEGLRGDATSAGDPR